uniref:Uncharacterized protein n=1 Tax=Magallana gigas TaxID=29159 RepID=A0A8W8IKF4_MAGGI
MSKYSIHVVLFTTNTCCGGINMLMRQLQLLAIIVGIVRACPEDCKCFSKTLDCSFRRLKELFNIHDNYQTCSLGSLRFFFIYKIMRFYLEERGMCHNQCFFTSCL